MKELIFRPLRFDKKLNKIVVASYSQWYKVRCANYSEFSLTLINEYENMDKSAIVHNDKGEELFHFNYNPWDVFVYHGSCLDTLFSWDELRNTHKSFSIDNGDYINYHWQGADCNGTPTFTHLTANKIIDGGYKNMNDFEPVTVGYVLDWLGWFLYQLENSRLKVTAPTT